MDILHYLEIVKDWLLNDGIKITVIIIAVILIRLFSKPIIDRIIRKIIVADHDDDIGHEGEKKREDTLIGVTAAALNIGVVLVAIIMILSELGMNIAPLLAAAGVVGLAVGFGAQSLVRDFFTGLFILLENQFRVGDSVKIGDVAGTVENISLRITTIRDMDGSLHHIPNGEIKIASNRSKEFSKVNLEVGVSYNDDLEKVKKVVNQVGEELAKDKDWKDKIIEPPQFLRVNNFGDSSVDIKIVGKTKPLEQWAVTGELRFRLKIAFDKEGIEIPFPQRVIHQAK